MSKRFKRPRPITEAQRAAARANGAKSHGPVTDEGKAKAAMNALRHGLTAATLVLTTEEKGKFDELLGAYIDEYQPATQTESDLVQEITVSKWLQRRCWALQTALLDVTMDRMEDDIDAEFKEIPNATRTALAFAKEANEGGALALLNRYAGRHSREWHKSLDKLRAIQAERRAEAAEKAKLPNEPGDLVQNKIGDPAPHTDTPEPQRPDFAISQNEPKSAQDPSAELATVVLQNEPERALKLLKSIAADDAARPSNPLPH